MEAHCLYFERRPVRLTGNLLLCQQLGARLHFVPLGGDSGPRDLHRTCQLVRLAAPFLPGIGRRGVVFIPVGGHSALGCSGYVPAAREILKQAALAGFRPDVVVTAAGTGGTMAGLLAGFRLLESPVHLIGVDVGKLWRSFEADIATMAGDVTGTAGRSPAVWQPRTWRWFPATAPAMHGHTNRPALPSSWRRGPKVCCLTPSTPARPWPG